MYTNRMFRLLAVAALALAGVLALLIVLPGSSPDAIQASERGPFLSSSAIYAAPIAVDDSGLGFTTDENTAFTTTNVLTNDTDLDGDPLSVQSFDATGTLGLVFPAGGGELDIEGFGAPNGYVVTTFNLGWYNPAQDIAIQPDGKLVVAGYAEKFSDDDFAVARYNPDGSLDTSFDDDGKIITDLGFWDYGRSVAIQPDGKIVVAGASGQYPNYDFAVVRYNSDGSLDTSFDGDGKITTDFGSNDDGSDVAIQSDGKIVVIGYTESSPTTNFAIVRYNPDGSLDATFDGDGKVTTNFGGHSYGFSITIQPDGKIVVVGFASDNFAVARYNPDGSLDTSFDSDGLVTTDFGDIEYGLGVVIQSDGKLVVVGYTGLPYSNSEFALARYNTNGSLDTSFDGDGKVITNLGDISRSSDVALQSDGKIVVVGSAINENNEDFALARYNPDGSLDTSFDDDGLVTSDFGHATYEHAYGVAIQSDGKIVVVGSDYDFIVARYDTGGSIFTYNPNDQFEWLAAGEVATDTFTYVVSDGTLTDTATVSITIIGVNDAPLAVDDSGPGFTTDEDTAFTTTSVLTNDIDLDGDPLTVQSYDTSGMLGLVSPGGSDDIFTYNPNGQFEWLAAGEVATDTFTYVVSDGALTDTATVSITVIGINAAPIAVDDSGAGFTTDEDTAFTTTSVLTNDTDLDGDPLTVQSYDTSGMLGLVSPGGGDGIFTYNPNGQFEWLAAGEVTTDTFTYVVSDGALTDTATVSLTVVGVNDAPVLGTIGDKSVAEGIQLTFTVTATDVDLSNSLTFTLDAGAPVGASLTAGGEFSWTPDETQGPGIYTATLRVSDGVLDDAKTITITVEEVNTAPMLGSIGNKAVDELATLVFTATATDGDIPTQTLTFSLDAGSVGSITAGGVFTWTPQTAGSYTATVRVSDDGILPLDDAETITITVNEVGAAPGVPILLWPANGTVTTTQAITLTWQAGPGDPPIGYNLLLDGELVTTSATFSATILPFGVHTWTVRAYNAEGYSNWANPAWTVEIIQHRIYLPIVLR